MHVDQLEGAWRAPAPRDGLVRRTPLLKRLERSRGFPVILVTAPAGYGKTTLLAQWTMCAEGPVGWLSLDDTHSDAEVLIESMLTALESLDVDPDCPEQRLTLVLDDAHLPSPEALGDVVMDAVDWLPQGLQLIIASRCEPALPLGRMRGHRMLLELDAEDLAMSTAEAAALLRGAGIELDFAATQELVSRTEGWPAALELAVGSITAREDPAEGLSRLAGDDHHFTEYFRSEFLASLSPASVRFLIRSSVLESLSGPLCDEVLQRSGSAGLLARLMRMNVPLCPVDQSHEWYRLHGLFREMLQTELRRTEPDLRPQLHSRAAEWHLTAGNLDQAIGHARSAGDLKRTGELLWPNLPQYLGDGRNGPVQVWLSDVRAEDLSQSSSLALASANSQLALGNIALAEQCGRAAKVAAPGATADQAEAERAAFLIIGAWAARSGAAGMGDEAEQAYELLPVDSPWRASCCYLRGTSALLTGHPREAERHLKEGEGLGTPVARDIAALCLAQLAVVSLDANHPELAGDRASRARSLIGRRDVSQQPILALVFAVSAAAEAALGRLDEAKTAALRCAGLAESLDQFTPWYGAEIRILLARGLLTLGDVAAAREQLAVASRLARRMPDVPAFGRWFDDAWGRFDQRAETALLGAASLTTAELRVLRFLPTHFSFHEIAERLSVSSNTVKTHVHAVYRKLDASSRSEAVANATHAGLFG